MGRLKVIALGDLHFPFTDFKKLFSIYPLIEKEQPDIVVQVGDCLDFYSQSRFARSQDIMTPKEELQEGLECYRNFWEKIKKITKKRCRLIQIGGNHTDRPIKLALEKAPELLPFLDVDKMFKIRGIETHMNSRNELDIEGVLYIHGWYSNSLQHAKYFNRSVVHGHLHRGGVFFENMKDGPLWSLDCGYLADPHQVPMLYRPTKTQKWSHGFGIIDKLGPRFCPI